MRIFGRDLRALYGQEHHPRLRRGIPPDRRSVATPVEIAVRREINILTYMAKSY